MIYWFISCSWLYSPLHIVVCFTYSALSTDYSTVLHFVCMTVTLYDHTGRKVIEGIKLFQHIYFKTHVEVYPHDYICKNPRLLSLLIFEKNHFYVSELCVNIRLKVWLDLSSNWQTLGKNSHICKEGGPLTPSKDKSRGKILCFRVQVYVRPRTNLTIFLGTNHWDWQLCFWVQGHTRSRKHLSKLLGG